MEGGNDEAPEGPNLIEVVNDDERFSVDELQEMEARRAIEEAASFSELNTYFDEGMERFDNRLNNDLNRIVHEHRDLCFSTTQLEKTPSTDSLGLHIPVEPQKKHASSVKKHKAQKIAYDYIRAQHKAGKAVSEQEVLQELKDKKEAKGAAWFRTNVRTNFETETGSGLRHSKGPDGKLVFYSPTATYQPQRSHGEEFKSKALQEKKRKELLNKQAKLIKKKDAMESKHVEKVAAINRELDDKRHREQIKMDKAMEVHEERHSVKMAMEVEAYSKLLNEIDDTLAHLMSQLKL